jgi:hypothetical protein
MPSMHATPSMPGSLPDSTDVSSCYGAVGSAGNMPNASGQGPVGGGYEFPLTFLLPTPAILLWHEMCKLDGPG